MIMTCEGKGSAGSARSAGRTGGWRGLGGGREGDLCAVGDAMPLPGFMRLRCKFVHTIWRFTDSHHDGRRQQLRVIDFSISHTMVLTYEKCEMVPIQGQGRIVSMIARCICTVCPEFKQVRKVVMNTSQRFPR